MYRKRVVNVDIMSMLMKNRKILVYERSVFFVIMIFENNKEKRIIFVRKVTLFIAMSLDGYIADSDEKVDWLVGHDKNIENMEVYNSFIKNIDTVIMGWKTYHQIITELSPNEWVYEGMTSYILTHQNHQSTSQIFFTDEKPSQLIHHLKRKEGKGIWICGGANVIQQILQEDMIDEFYISITPTLLGKGISLFGILDKKIDLRLIKTQSYNGITDLIYQRR